MQHLMMLSALAIFSMTALAQEASTLEIFKVETLAVMTPSQAGLTEEEILKAVNTGITCRQKQLRLPESDDPMSDVCFIRLVPTNQDKTSFVVWGISKMAAKEKSLPNGRRRLQAARWWGKLQVEAERKLSFSLAEGFPQPIFERQNQIEAFYNPKPHFSIAVRWTIGFVPPDDEETISTNEDTTDDPRESFRWLFVSNHYYCPTVWEGVAYATGFEDVGFIIQSVIDHMIELGLTSETEARRLTPADVRQIMRQYAQFLKYTPDHLKHWCPCLFLPDD